MQGKSTTLALSSHITFNIHSRAYDYYCVERGAASTHVYVGVVNNVMRMRKIKDY